MVKRFRCNAEKSAFDAMNPKATSDTSSADSNSFTGRVLPLDPWSKRRDQVRIIASPKGVSGNLCSDSDRGKFLAPNNTGRYQIVGSLLCPNDGLDKGS